MGHQPMGADIFPLPMRTPPPTVRHSRSRRIQRRQQQAQRLSTTTNQCIEALNSLHRSYAEPANPPDPILQMDEITTAARQRTLNHIDRCVKRLIGRPPSADADESSANEIASINPADDHRLLQFATDGYGKSMTATNIVADKVALPTRAGAVPFLDKAPPQLRALYNDADSGSIRPPDQKDDNKAHIPKARFKGKRNEYIKLLRRMMEADMITFTTEPKVVNGVFGTPKPDGTMRLIIDARPANAAFIKPPDIELPTPDLITKLTLPAEQSQMPIYVAKCDLSDFFYRFRTPEWMHPYFALPPIRPAELGAEARNLNVGHDRRSMVWPCITVLAMGWSHSVYITQLIHEYILDSIPSLQSQDRITHSNDFALNRTRHMVYIDDVIFFSSDREAAEHIQTNYINKMEAELLPVKRNKIISPSSEGVECLGVEMVGNDRTIGVNPNKLMKLIADTNAVINRGICDGRTMASIVGKWTWAMLIVRPALATFGAVYNFCEKSGKTPFVLWPSVIKELKIATAIAPLLWTTINLPWFESIMATDASMDGLGVCSTTGITIDQLNEASHHCGVPDMRNYNADDEAKVNQVLLRSANGWNELIAARWRRQDEHINSLEARALSTTVRRCLSQPSSTHHRLLILSDSQVVVGAITKGRTSSPDLLRRIRSISALLLAAGIKLFVRWIPSADNPADAASRRHSRPIHNGRN